MSARHFLTDQRGSIAILFAFAAVILIGAVGIALDFALWSKQRTRLQEAADAAALAGAVELGIGGNQATTRAENKARKMGANERGAIAGLTETVTADATAGTVTVSYVAPVRRSLSSMLSKSDGSLDILSVARIADRKVACIYALNPSAAKSLEGNGSATLEGVDCAIQVNSSNADAMSNSGIIKASNICVVGGYSGTGYTPAPKTACPALDDPFASTVIPAPGPCTSTNAAFNADVMILASNDVFCGGLQVTSAATATFQAGVYHIVDGPLKLAGSSSIVGDGVTFVLSGKATIDIAGTGRAATTPPTSGGLAGFSIVQDRSAPLGGVSKVSGDGEFNFPGVIYLPRSDLEVAGRALGNVYTPTYAAIVADTIKISGEGALRATANLSPLPKKDAAKLTAVNVVLTR